MECGEWSVENGEENEVKSGLEREMESGDYHQLRKPIKLSCNSK